jgi:hypothetical protein
LPIVLSGRLRLTDSDYSFGIFCPLCCLVFFDLQFLITPLVSFAHCVVWSSSTYRFWLLLWYLLPIVLSGLLRLTYSDYSFGIFWPLRCLVFFDLQILITPLVSFAHCVVWSSSAYIFWLLFWYLLTIALSGRLRLTDSDYPFAIFWPIVLSGLLRSTDSDYSFGIFKHFLKVSLVERNYIYNQCPSLLIKLSKQFSLIDHLLIFDIDSKIIPLQELFPFKLANGPLSHKVQWKQHIFSPIIGSKFYCDNLWIFYLL